MDRWSTEEVVKWLNGIGLSKYAKRFKGYLVNGAVLLQMDETLLDDLGVTDSNDRQTFLRETAKLTPPKTDESQSLSTKKQARFTVKNLHVLQTPIITVSDFDDDDNDDKIDPVSDDEELTNNTRRSLNEQLLNHRIVNVAYSGDESTSDDGSERDFSFKDSDEEHDFDIYDEHKDTTVDLSPAASAVATRATQMVELLSRDNVALREKLESVYIKMNNMQMLECELESMRAAYDELQISSRRRENLEWSARRKMDTEIERLQENNKQLQDELQKCKDEVQEDKKSLEKCKSDLQLKNNVIRQLISQSNSFAKTREDLENTINQQRRQIEELLQDKEQLHSSFVQSRERIANLEKELYPDHVSPLRKARALQVIQRGAATLDTFSTTDEQTVNRRHSSSPDEGIAELDGPTSVPALLELLKEKDERIQVLGDQLLRLEQTLQQEGTSRNLAIRAVSMPKEARIAALENSIQESEKIIAECRGQNLKSIEELYVANRRCADLESIIKSLHSQLSEKSAKIRLLQNNNDQEHDDEPNEPEWPLDPAFCRTDFAHMKDLARESYAESLDSGMSLSNAIELRQTDPEFKTMDEPDQVSVHFWSV